MTNAQMNLKRMMVLVAVHHSGSLSGAAKELHYTTSAVSQQIALLEKEAGFPLVERVPRGIRITDAGRIVVRHAERMERILEAAHRELSNLGGLRSGTLRLGTFPTFTRALLPEVLAQFRQAHPDVEVNLLSETRSELRQRLESGEIELAFLWDFSWDALVANGDEEITFLKSDPCVVVVPSAHRFANRTEVGMWELRSEPWITRASAAGRTVLERTCALDDFVPHVVFEAQNYQEIQSMVASSLGVALVPRSSVSEHATDVRALTLGDRAPVRRLYYARRWNSRMSPAAAAMYAILRDI